MYESMRQLINIYQYTNIPITTTEWHKKAYRLAVQLNIPWILANIAH